MYRPHLSTACERARNGVQADTGRKPVASGGRVRVVVADGHPIYREGLVRAIKERWDLELVGEAADGRTALSVIKELGPDVAVVDLGLPDLDGAHVLRAAIRDGVPARMLVLAETVDSSVAYAALEAGAAGCLTKDADKLELCDAIAAAARGEIVLSREIQTGIAGQIRLRACDDRPVLTRREQEILSLVAEGYSAGEIGRKLYVSMATVKSHQQHLYRKLGVSERAAAVAEAMRRGLLD